MDANWPFDPDEPFESKLIPANAKMPDGDTPLHLVAAWNAPAALSC